MSPRFTSDPRISYWRKGLASQNFGDLLSELLFEGLSQRTRSGGARKTGKHDVVHLIGSVISDWHIERDLEHVRAGSGRRIAFWGCGVRDDRPIHTDLLERCEIFGVRGPISREVLGLPPDTPIGDPGLLLPLLYQPRALGKRAAETICVPHFLDPKTDDQLLELTGVSRIVRPNVVCSRAALTSVIDAIANARFVLCGALHAAIVACAYGRPFAYFDSGYVDVPLKWRDFAASIGIPCRFATNLAEGRRIFDEQLASQITIPPLAPLVALCPLNPPSRFVRRLSP